MVKNEDRRMMKTGTKALVTLASMVSNSEAWLLPVPSPIMSLPVIESIPHHPSTAMPVSVSMPIYSRDDENETTSINEAKPVSSTKAFKVFCDLDGVLVDFEHGIRQLFSSESTASVQFADLDKPNMWKSVRQAGAFFEHLPWTSDGRELWQAIQHLQPDILTGVPIHPSSRDEKYRWCVRELGSENFSIEHVDMACPWTRGHRALKKNKENKNRNLHNQEMKSICRVITCWSSNKHHESGPGHVLIDDRLALRAAWERKGGIFIHHQPGHLEGTLNQLEEHGILQASPA